MCNRKMYGLFILENSSLDDFLLKCMCAKFIPYRFSAPLMAHHKIMRAVSALINQTLCTLFIGYIRFSTPLTPECICFEFAFRFWPKFHEPVCC